MDRLLSLLPPLFLLAACAGTPSDQPIDAGSGANPTLPSPESKAIPTVNVAPAKGWSGDQKPSAAAGFAVSSYAADLDHPRWLYVLPNGDVLVAETNAPERPEDKKGIKGYFMGKAQKKAGAGVPSANRITLLRDRRRRQGRIPQRIPQGPEFAVRHGAGRQRLLRREHGCGHALQVPRGCLDHRRTGHESRGPAGRADQPSLDQEPDREPRRQASVRHRRLEQQRRRARHGERGATRRDPGDRCGDRRIARVRFGIAQSERPGLAAAERRALDRGQRARRARQRSRARLHHLGEGRRFLRLAV